MRRRPERQGAAGRRDEAAGGALGAVGTPLVPLVTEVRVAGHALAAGGVVLTLVGLGDVTIRSPLGVLAVWAACALGMYGFTRRGFRRWVRTARYEQVVAIEAAAATRRRAARRWAVVLVVQALIAVIARDPLLVGLLTSAFGVALVLYALHVERWEDANASRALTVPIRILQLRAGPLVVVPIDSTGGHPPVTGAG